MSKQQTPPHRTRRLGGWGFEDASFAASPQLLTWLEHHIGPPGPPLLCPERLAKLPRARELPALGIEVSTDPGDRLAHARGQGLPDLVHIRGGALPAAPDGVCRPTDAEAVERVLAGCAGRRALLIPWGGGTSVTGGVTVIPSAEPVLVLDMERLSGLISLDTVSGLATFGAGTTGPQVEAALARHGLTLGHYPQSWELATVGGWVATRSSGQESLGAGRIEDMVAGLEVVAPAGRISTFDLPASAAGPDLRQLVLGSEGRLGVITRVTLRVRPRPSSFEVEAALLPELGAGIEACRELTQHELGLQMLRLSDAPETQVALAVGLAATRGASWLRRLLRWRGIGEAANLVLCGASGEPAAVDRTLSASRAVLRRHGAVGIGRGPGRTWKRDRFRHPYLRDALLDLGYATDTLETAVPWSKLVATRASIATAIAEALRPIGERVAVLCHLSHPYRDGASLYFTFFFRCAAEPEQTVARWACIKRAASQALVNGRATLSHHHGVGQWHAPWLAQEIGETGLALLRSAARTADPEALLNPSVLLDPSDRLEL